MSATIERPAQPRPPAPEMNAQRTSTDRRVWLLGLLMMGVLVVGCYLVSINAWWVGDDFNYVRPKTWSEVLNFFNPVGRAVYRPLNWSIWAGNFALFGAEPLGWHITHIAQHIFNSVVAALLARALTGSVGLGLLAGALFALHPAHGETITQAGLQADSTFAMFFFPAVWMFVRWRQGAGKGRTWWWWAGVLGFLSMRGKEAAIVLPAVTIWTDLFFGRRWERWRGERGAGWWRDRGVWLALLRDHSLFIGASAAIVAMRLILFLAGQGRLMYGEAQFGFLQYPLDITAGYILLALGFWWLPPDVYAWPLLWKVGVILAAVAAVVLLARWLGRIVPYAVGWTAITLALTLQAVAPRWFYVPAFGMALIGAAIWGGLRTAYERREARGRAVRLLRLAPAVPLALIVAWGWGTVLHNDQWRESGEMARSILTQVRQIFPNPPRPVTFYYAGEPERYRNVYLFNTGFDSGLRLIYRDWEGVRAYKSVPPSPEVVQALADPAALGPNPIFIRYEEGRIVQYPTLSALVEANGP
ncbi:MAG TPA: hypothetical protein VFR15_07510 [Chloroflexia bacterium]|nr:hypothetical protein [Chloroflexia bacterium]